MQSNSLAPVITIDGPSASGKGTISTLVAQALGWHVLDSGALYRLTALACRQQGINTEDGSKVAQIAAQLDIHFDTQGVYLNKRNVSDAIKTEEIGHLASVVAAHPEVRQALLQKQLDFRQDPGLVADGRDMGTVIFPEAPLKIFLEADVQERARRRYKQLKEKGFSAKMSDLVTDLQSRDKRDRERANGPLKKAPDAYTIDSTHMSTEAVVQQVLDYWQDINSK
ncbi:(d)CMP kinase [Brackiella oedipodis]|uniref:(d)CMP kinase n=1 Tax=Brackiella oedipodis TaxID=124225 RepID=UPI000490FDBB|nr:(d)CMP kinase [Brackiella oedipodis]